MRPESVCHGFSRSTLIVNAAYARPSSSMPDHSGEVITRRGWTCVSWNVIRVSSAISARSASGTPQRSSSDLKPATDRRPLVTPESARIVSATCCGRSSDGRPSATPPRAHAVRAASWATSRSGIQDALLTVEPSFSASGPSAAHMSATAG